MLDSLRHAESQAAQEQQTAMKLSGALEGDATGLRSFIVKVANKHYAAEIREHQRKHDKENVYRVWVRVLGLAQERRQCLHHDPLA